MTTLMVVWTIVFTANTGHRLEMPGEYFTEKECVEAAQQMSLSTRGSAVCVSKNVSAPETIVTVPALTPQR